MQMFTKKVAVVLTSSAVAFLVGSAQPERAAAHCDESMCGTVDVVAWSDQNGSCYEEFCDHYVRGCTQNPRTGNCYMATPGDPSTAICDNGPECFQYQYLCYITPGCSAW
jgi:hypothetical protein